MDQSIVTPSSIDVAFSLIEGLARTSVPGEYFSYHDRYHTNDVRNRGWLLGIAFGLSDRELQLEQHACTFHDVFQNWHPMEKPDGSIVRVRHGGPNELKSADVAVDELRNRSPDCSSFDQGLVAHGILATIPDWDKEHGTVFQPFLNAASHPVIRAVALADLGDAGMDTESFLKAGPKLFLEENLDVSRTITIARRSSAISADQQEWYRNRFVGWLKIQPTFAKGRQQRLEMELANYYDQAKHLFHGFNESIERAEVAVAQAQRLEFVPLMRLLLQKAFPDEGM